MDENKKENVEKVVTKKKSNFVPSYNRKNEEPKKEDKKDKKIKSKITVIILALVLIIAIVISSVLLFRNTNKEIVTDYNKLMDDYGLSRLYNNGKSNSLDTVTKSEALKILLAVTMNTEDITKYMPDDLLYKITSTNNNENEEESNTINLDELFSSVEKKEEIKEEYENEYWVRYARSINFITDNEINTKNYNDKVTFGEIIKYISNAKTVIIGKNLDTELTPEFKNYDDFDNETKWRLSDLVKNGIIENSKSKIDLDKAVTKSTLNEMIINFVLKYNLITVGEDKVNINEEKMPENKDEFAYTLASVDKKVYETENYKANENYKNSIEVFPILKQYYEAINQQVEQYYNALLNINYETITTEELYISLVPNSMYIISEDEINTYVEYVKQNKIKVSGEAKVQNPIIYFDGQVYRARTKISYNIENADNLKNIFFKDIDSTYEKGKKTIYIDVPISSNQEVTSFYIIPETMSNMISGKITSIQE